MTKTANLGIPEKEGGRRIFNNWLYVLSATNFSLPGHRTKGINLFIAMNLLFVFTLATCLTVHATSFSQKVTFKGENVPILQVFSAIKEQTGYLVIANAAFLDKMPAVTISATNMLLYDFVARILQDQPLQFFIKYATIVISPKDAGQKNMQHQADVSVPFELDQALLHHLTIRVLDSDGNALSGASVTNKTNKKTGLTGANGNYEMNATIGDVLEITFIGFEKQLYTVKDNTPLVLIRMKVASNNLDEVIRTAYGKTSKRLATGDIVKVTAEEIQRQPVMNPLLALAGKVPGLMISQTTGYASSPVKVLLRGQMNLNSGVNSEPLYVIDGVPLTIINASGNYLMGSMGYDQSDPLWNGTPTRGMSPLFSINPMDIESIEVLKDADATAIYGAQGANGAILITTKTGKAGPVQLGLSISGGIKKARGAVEYLSTPEYMSMRREALKNDGITPSAITAPDLFIWDTTRNVNWQHELFGRAGIKTDYDLSLSGGNQQLNFRVSAGYGRESDITTVSGATQRITLNSSTNYTSQNNSLNLSLAFNLANLTVNVKELPNDPSLPPNAPAIYDSTGKLNWSGWMAGQDAIFPKIPFVFGSLDNEYPSKGTTLGVNLQINYNLLKGLKFSTRLGYNEFNTQSDNFTPISGLNPSFEVFNRGKAGFTTTKGSGLTIEPTLNYVLQLGKSKFDVTIGGSTKSALSKYSSIIGNGYTNDDLLHQIGSAASVTASNTHAEHKFAGFFGIFNYNLSNTYILNLNIRRDGSSKFGPGRRYGNFGSVGAAWIASDEKWMTGVLPTAISYMKLRGSFGVVGSDGVGDYQYISQWGPGVPALYSYAGITPLKSLHAVNPLFQWQEARKLSASIDLGLFKDKLSINATYYRDKMGNQLVQFPISMITGFGAVTANSPALVQNSGWEFQLSLTFLKSASFSWSGGFSLSLNRNKLVAYPNFDQSPYRQIYQIGKPLNLVPLLHYTGVDPLTGDFSYLDRNNDGTVTITGGLAGFDEDDRYWVNRAPKYFGGFSSQITYKSWSLSMQFSYNRAVESNPLWNFMVGGTSKNILKEVYDKVWKKPGDKTAYPMLRATNTYNGLLFSRSDGSYVDAFSLTFQNISLRYTLQDKLVRKMGVKGCSFSVQTQDLLSVSLKGHYNPGINSYGIPLPKVLLVNFNVQF